MTRAELTEILSAVQYVCRGVMTAEQLEYNLRAQLAALPEPDEPAAPRIQDGETGVILARCWNREITPGKAYELLAEQPWTDRERRLRAELEWQLASLDEGFFSEEGLFTCTECSRSAHDDAALIIHSDECCSGRLRAALADTPPPDARDEALEAAEKALKYAILYLLGAPKAYGKVHGALAAIARVKGGR